MTDVAATFGRRTIRGFVNAAFKTAAFRAFRDAEAGRPQVMSRRS